MACADEEQQTLFKDAQQTLSSAAFLPTFRAVRRFALVLIAVASACSALLMTTRKHVKNATPIVSSTDIDAILLKYAQGPPDNGPLTQKVRAKFPKCITFCSTRSEHDCKSDEGFNAGCAWCAGLCQHAHDVQSWIVDRVRNEWSVHAPGRINGEKVPGDVCAANSTTIFEGQDPLGQGQFWGTYKDHRPYPYRVPIHIHMYEGQTCMVAGKIHMYMEGIEPQTFGPEKCYVMPANTKMANAPIDEVNGYTDTDTFHLPNSCAPTWVVVEPGAWWIQDAQFVTSHDDCPSEDGLNTTLPGNN